MNEWLMRAIAREREELQRKESLPQWLVDCLSREKESESRAYELETASIPPAQPGS